MVRPASSDKAEGARPRKADAAGQRGSSPSKAHRASEAGASRSALSAGGGERLAPRGNAARSRSQGGARAQTSTSPVAQGHQNARGSGGGSGPTQGPSARNRMAAARDLAPGGQTTPVHGVDGSVAGPTPSTQGGRGDRPGLPRGGRGRASGAQPTRTQEATSKGVGGPSAHAERGARVSRNLSDRPGMGHAEPATAARPARVSSGRPRDSAPTEHRNGGAVPATVRPSVVGARPPAHPLSDRSASGARSRSLESRPAPTRRPDQAAPPSASSGRPAGGRRGPGSSPAHGSAPSEERRPYDPRRAQRRQAARVDLPDDVTAKMLDPEVRSELRSLSKETADLVARHLVVTGELLAEDPIAALAHARAARALAARVGPVREAAGLAAYAAQDWQDALGELRAARRITGRPGHLAVMADCERALGRPERALAHLQDKDVARLTQVERIELVIVASGARRDLGEPAAAVLLLQEPARRTTAARPWATRLWYAHADALLDAGREAEAREWFERAAESDADSDTDAAERLLELDGVVFSQDGEPDDGPQAWVVTDAATAAAALQAALARAEAVTPDAATPHAVPPDAATAGAAQPGLQRPDGPGRAQGRAAHKGAVEVRARVAGGIGQAPDVDPPGPSGGRAAGTAPDREQARVPAAGPVPPVTFADGVGDR